MKRTITKIIAGGIMLLGAYAAVMLCIGVYKVGMLVIEATLN